MRSDIAPGGTFPDCQLPDHENVPRKLSELQGDDPLILPLARGHTSLEFRASVGDPWPFLSDSGRTVR
jgi:hypothetical protein